MPAKPRLSAKAAQEERKARDVFMGTFVLNAVAAVLNLSGKRSAGAVLLLLMACGLVVWLRLNTRGLIARQSGVRKLAAYTVQGIPIAILVWSAWVFFRPETRDELVERLSSLARAKSWAALAQELPAIEDDSPFRDVGFHFRGMVAIESMPGRSPELFLSQVPSSSNLFALTQRLRLVALTKLPPDESLAAAARVANEMKEVQLLNTTYYRLRLMEPSLSYSEVAKLSSEFAAKHGSFFDFTSMRNRNIASEVGRPVSIDLHEVMSIPAWPLCST